jgi:hypothetical protein
VGAAASSDGEYTSPTYGYSISWDPAVWTAADEYVGSYDSLTLQSAAATFMLTGTSVFDDLSVCVAESIAGLQIGVFTPATGIVGPTPAPGAEGALMTADVPTDAGTTAPVVAYFECRWVHEGESTVAVTLLGPADTFEQAVPLFDALMAGLVLPGAVPQPSGPTTTVPAATASTATTTPGAVAIPPATQQPAGLGKDPALNVLAHACYDGDMTACDDLYTQSATGSLFEQYGDTCAGRQPLGAGVYCADVFGGVGQSTAPVSTVSLATGSSSTGPAVSTTAAIPVPASTAAVPSAPTPVTTVASAVDPTSEAAVFASMLQPPDVSPGAESSGIGPDDDVDLPGWTENGGIRALSQTLFDDAMTVFDFRWQFPDAASASAFLDAAEADLSEVSDGSQAAAAPVTPVADTRYYTFSSNLFTPVVGFNYLMRHENIVAKVYVSGPEGDVTEQDAARIAQAAGDRMLAAHSG